MFQQRWDLPAQQSDALPTRPRRPAFFFGGGGGGKLVSSLKLSVYINPFSLAKYLLDAKHFTSIKRFTELTYLTDLADLVI